MKGGNVKKVPKLMVCAVWVGLVAMASGCVVRPVVYRDGYWDREHARYWYGNAWHPCGDRPEYCR
jgi:hypothetical protein